MSKMYTNPERRLVCEVYDDKVINGPLYTNHPKKGYLLPVRVIHASINPMDEFSGTAVFEITDSEILATYPAVQHSAETRLGNYRMRALKKAKEDRQAKEIGGLVVPGFTHKLDTSRAHQTELTTKVKAALLLPEGDPTTYPVLTEDGYVSVDIPMLKTISAALIAHVQACFSEQRAKEEAIAAAATVEEVLAI